MSLFDDILKGLPANAVLREQITILNTQKAAAETENAILKDDLRKAKTEIAQLKKQIKELTQQDDLPPVELEILKQMADMGVDLFSIERIYLQFAMTKPRLEYLINKLCDSDYACLVYSDNWGSHFGPTQKGLELLARKNLI